jgi:hypothetical protein
MLAELLVSLPFVVLLVKGKDHLAPDLGERIDDDGAGIRCPSCKWRPARTDEWACNPGCGYAWNTFETRGECPSCGKRWSSTQCIKCGAWNSHDDWYEEKKKK